jgi:hypothetical protein
MIPFRGGRALFAVIALVTFPAGPALAGHTLAITHANVVNVRDGTVKREVTILIDRVKITAIRKGAPKPRSGAREYGVLLANGVLGIRDMGDKPETIFPAREQTASGRVLGPRIVACGPIIDGPDPTNPPLSLSVHGPEEGRAAVDNVKRMGADCVKVHDGVPLDAYNAIAAEARAVGLPLVGHVPVRVRVLDATEAGQRTIEHQIGVNGLSTVEDEVMRQERTHDVFAEPMRTKNYALCRAKAPALSS